MPGVTPCGRASCQAAVLPYWYQCVLGCSWCQAAVQGKGQLHLLAGKGVGKGLLSPYLLCAVPFCLRTGV